MRVILCVKSDYLQVIVTTLFSTSTSSFCLLHIRFVVVLFGTGYEKRYPFSVIIYVHMCDRTDRYNLRDEYGDENLNFQQLHYHSQT